ncbi:MAG: tetratricopeptide repeat protein [Methylococcales bacterium]
MPKYLRIFLKLFAWGVFGFAIAYGVLITPDNPFTRIFRGEISDASADIIVGPYPVEKDFQRLQANGIETIVSLLDPALPYEKQLLNQEAALAKQYKIRLLSFPMASILGQKLGDYYNTNANAAADAILVTKGKIYLHCYLGIHRVAAVRNILEGKQLTVARYTVQKGERSQQALELDTAEKYYREGNYSKAKQQLASMQELSPAARLLGGWVEFRLGNNTTARKAFEEAALSMPDATDPQVGLGYCDIRENYLGSAEIHFTRAIQHESSNAEALHGMGLIRYRQGRLQEATDFFKQVLAIDPQHVEAKDTLQRLQDASKTLKTKRGK